MEKRIYREIDGDRAAQYMETAPFYYPETNLPITDVIEYAIYMVMHTLSRELAVELFLLSIDGHKNINIDVHHQLHRDGNDWKLGITLVLKYTETP